MEKDQVIENYRSKLKHGELTFIGLLTDGGQGLATGDNGRYIGAIEGSKEAERIKETLPKKLYTAIKSNKIQRLSFITSIKDAQEFLKKKSEQDKRELFDKLKQEFGKNIFGQGYLFRIINKREIKDANQLSDEEKLNGSSKDKAHFVLYSKGDKLGNQWLTKSNFFIDWSKENVDNLRTRKESRWQGYNYFFRDGFCWNDILNPKSCLIKTKLKEKSVNDVNNSRIFPTFNN